MKGMKFPGFAERGAKASWGKKVNVKKAASKAWSAVSKVAKSMPAGRMGRPRGGR